MKLMLAGLVALVAALDPGCDPPAPSVDEKQAAAQAQALAQAHAAIGMPAITHFEEKRMMKDIYELRDRAVATHAYIVNEMAGCLVYLGPAVGYGLPYATQYTAPTRWDLPEERASGQVPQAEPNGLFMPSSAEGTWIMLKDPASDKVAAVYVEPRVIVSPFRIPARECPTKP